MATCAGFWVYVGLSAAYIQNIETAVWCRQSVCLHVNKNCLFNQGKGLQELHTATHLIEQLDSVVIYVKGWTVTTAQEQQADFRTERFQVSSASVLVVQPCIQNN